MGICQSKKDAHVNDGEPIIIVNHNNQDSSITEIDLVNRRIVVIKGAHGTVSTSLISQMNDNATKRDVSFSM